MTQLVTTFQSFRSIICVCPCCGELHHLSDLHLKYKGKTPKTWLDTYRSKVLSLEKKEEKFQEKEKEIREKALERGRKQVDKLLKDALDKSLAECKYNPYDIKTILHPVDFVVFDGLNKKDELKDVTFLCRNLRGSALKPIQAGIEKAIKKKNYNWSIARVQTDGSINYE